MGGNRSTEDDVCGKARASRPSGAGLESNNSLVEDPESSLTCHILYGRHQAAAILVDPARHWLDLRRFCVDRQAVAVECKHFQDYLYRQRAAILAMKTPAIVNIVKFPRLSSVPSHKTPTATLFVCMCSATATSEIESPSANPRKNVTEGEQITKPNFIHSPSCVVQILMATPSDFVPPSERWRLPMDPSPRYRAVPRLPRIASLLAPVEDAQDLPLPVMFTRGETQRPAAPTSTPRSRARAVYQELKPSYVPVEISSLDVDPLRQAERRLVYHHSDPHKIHEIHIQDEICTPRYEQSSMSRKHPRTNRCQYELESAQKRRRVTHSPREPLYETEYGLTRLETPKSLLHSRYSQAQDVAAPRYVRGDSEEFERVKAPISVSRLPYTGSDRSFRPSVIETPAPRTPVHDKCETSPLTTLVLKSKEFLKSKNLVRNRHDEIDWVATFLKVGFDSSSIYALMCPLRKGRWKSEEENYTMGLLRLIENGTILLRHGQSIRGYIGEKLHSDDMRVLKKLSNCKMFHFAKLINPRLSEEEKLDMSVAGAQEGLEQLDQLKGEFLRSVQLEALVAVRKYLSDSSLRDLLNVRA